MKTDKERLDLLDEYMTGYGNGWVCRNSSRGRGLRLHESSKLNAYPTIREAIDAFINAMEIDIKNEE